jgi:hypothetical protein
VVQRDVTRVACGHVTSGLRYEDKPLLNLVVVFPIAHWQAGKLTNDFGE